MSRRMTLGPITNSMVNSRTSLGPSAQQKSSRHSISAGRMSLLGGVAAPAAAAAAASSGAGAGAASAAMTPSHGGRPSLSGRTSIPRTSMYGPKNGRVATDPRPINDRAFMNQAIRSLIEYLSEHNFNSAISPKILTRPTTKQFQDIVLFLLRQVDPYFQVSQKFENDITVMLRGLGYPFGISKSSLTAVGSPHTWPSLLACLSWVVELLTYDEMVRMEEESEDLSQDEGGVKIFLEYLSQSYKAFMSYDDAKYEALDQELRDSFAKRMDRLHEARRDAKAEEEALRSEVEALSAGSSVPAMKKKRAEYMAAVEKLRQQVATLREHQTSVERKIEERQAELRAKEATVSELEARRDELAARIDQQELSPQDVDRMSVERKRLQDALRAASDRRAEVNQQVWAAEEAIRAELEMLETSVGQYNDLALRLQLIPSSARNAEGRDFELQAHTSGLAPDEVEPAALLSRDIKRDLRPVIRDLKSRFVQQGHHVRAEALELQDQVEAVEEQRAEKEAMAETLATKQKRLEEQLRKDKEAFDRALRMRAEEQESVETQVACLREGSTAGQTVLQAQSLLQQLTEERAQQQRQHQEALAARRAQILPTLDRFMEYKAYAKQRLEAAHTRAQESLREMRSVRGQTLEAAAVQTCVAGVSESDVTLQLA